MEAALSGGRDSLFRWSVQLHNKVNSQLGKRIVPYEEAKEFWTKVSKGETLCLPNASPTETQLSSKKKKSDIVLYFIVFMLGVIITMLFTSVGRRRS